MVGDMGDVLSDSANGSLTNVLSVVIEGIVGTVGFDESILF